MAQICFLKNEKVENYTLKNQSCCRGVLHLESWCVSRKTAGIKRGQLHLKGHMSAQWSWRVGWSYYMYFFIFWLLVCVCLQIKECLVFFKVFFSLLQRGMMYVFIVLFFFGFFMWSESILYTYSQNLIKWSPMYHMRFLSDDDFASLTIIYR